MPSIRNLDQAIGCHVPTSRGYPDVVPPLLRAMLSGMNSRFGGVDAAQRWRSLSALAVITPMLVLLAGCETKQDRRYREQLATMTRLREQCEAQAPVATGVDRLNRMTDCWDRYPWPAQPKSMMGQFGDFLREHPVITTVVGFVIIIWIWNLLGERSAKRKAEQEAAVTEQHRRRAEAEAAESERLRQEEEVRAAYAEQERAAAAEYERRFQEEIARARRDEL